MKSRRIVKLSLSFVGACCLVAWSGTAAAAATIFSPVSGTATNSFPDPTFGTVDNLINQGGLVTPFTSGVTDFATYLAGDPQHGISSLGAEWFTAFNETGSILTFDLGSTTTINGIAVWTDEFWGAGNIGVALSLDGIGYTSVGGFAPTDWPVSVVTYGADVFSFAAGSARFVQLTLTNCPQPASQPGGGCGLGEVAFSQGETGTGTTGGGGEVPEPTTLTLLGLGLAGVIRSRLSRR